MISCSRSDNVRESEIQKQIIETLNANGCKVWRANAGTVRVGGRTIKLLPKGFPDVFGVRLTDGKFVAVEIKKPKGRVSDEQVKFRDFFEKHNVIHGIAHSPEEALEIVKEKMKNGNSQS
nr:VRR-NUC domain-containing protein [Staphylococcus hominis]